VALLGQLFVAMPTKQSDLLLIAMQTRQSGLINGILPHEIQFSSFMILGQNHLVLNSVAV
jgi:hypothetical protein